MQLTRKKFAGYERRTQLFCNSTIYIVQACRPEGLLSVFKLDVPGQLSIGIDYAAFVYDDLSLFLTESWMEAAYTILQTPRPARGLWIALFPCGCVLLNAYFTHVSYRLDGSECALLPGWVLTVKDVCWFYLNEHNVDSYSRFASSPMDQGHSSCSWRN